MQKILYPDDKLVLFHLKTDIFCQCNLFDDCFVIFY